jgi:mono/diheme cytochrome c family protein
MTRSRRPATLLAALALAFAAGCGGDDEPGEPADTGVTGGGSAQTQQQDTQTEAAGGGGAARSTFANTCGGCHTLKAAGTNGQVGPNLDELKPDEQRVRNAIRTGPGPMPENLLQGADADAVAKFVSENAGQ